jgi:hypothetical protein
MYAKYAQQFPPPSPKATRLAESVLKDFPPENEADVRISISPTESMYGERQRSKIRPITLRPRDYRLLKEHDPISQKVYFHLLVNAAAHTQIQQAQMELIEEHDFERIAKVLDVRENSTAYGAADWMIYPYAKTEHPDALKDSSTYLLKFRVVFWEKAQKGGATLRGFSLYDLRSVQENLPFSVRKLEVL